MTTDIRASEDSPRATPIVEACGRALRRYAIFIILAALMVFFDFAEPAFLRVNNLFSVLQSVAVVALLGIGVTVTLAVDGFDLSVDLLALGAPVPSPIAPVWAPAGTAQYGPNYADALGQAATSPVWAGGSYRLTVNAASAFPQTCAYLLQLYVWKRPIVDCVTVGIDEQYNVSFETFTIQVGCPPPCIPVEAKL